MTKKTSTKTTKKRTARAGTMNESHPRREAPRRRRAADDTGQPGEPETPTRAAGDDAAAAGSELLAEHQLSHAPAGRRSTSSRTSRIQAADGALDVPGGHTSSGPPCTSGHPDVLAAIREHHRQRDDFHRAEKRLTLQIKAIERRLLGAPARAGDDPDTPASMTVGDHGSIAGGSDHNGNGAVQRHPGTQDEDSPAPSNATRAAAAAATGPLSEAREHIRKFRRMHEKALARLVERLPVWPWVEAIRGVGALSFAQVVGEAGDVGSYRTPAALWKRFGLAVIAGERQRKCTDKAKAAAHGYCPRRRAILWNVGECLVKQNYLDPKADPKEPAAYRRLYLERKAFEKERNPEMSDLHAHRRAQRYMEKRFLRELWSAWRTAARDHETDGATPAANGDHCFTKSSAPGGGAVMEAHA